MSANKECELPAADSCAIMEGEGEEMEDDVVYSNKPSLLGKLKAIATKVSHTSNLKAFCIQAGFFGEGKKSSRPSSGKKSRT